MSRTSRLNWHRAVQARTARPKMSKFAAAASYYRSPRFEILENRLLLAADFGDAPAHYWTLLAGGGAYHEAIGPTLGAVRDTEENGVPSIPANGDDTSPVGGVDDEDGVTFGTMRAGQLGATITVNVQNAPSGALLDAWIDFDRDGSWGGAAEHVIDGKAVANGDNQITFDIPTSAVPGTTYARFRLTTAAHVGIGGVAADGEVEDYAVTILPPVQSGGVFGKTHTIVTDAGSVFQMFASDLDRDGDADVVAVRANEIRMYENAGAATFTPKVLVANIGVSGPVTAADLDGDGDNDLIAVKSTSGGAGTFYDEVVWFENDGNENFSAHESNLLYDDIPSAVPADLNADGWMDIIFPTQLGIGFARNLGDGGFAWGGIPTDVLARTATGSDIDSDGDMDVLITSRNNDKVSWLENTGGFQFTERVIATGTQTSRHVTAVDLDRDGDMDVLCASVLESKVVWYQNDGNQVFTERVVENVNEAARAYPVDIDGDQDLDIISAAGGRLAWHENNGQQVFTHHLIADELVNSSSFVPFDMDRDGDIDVVGLADHNGTIEWLENLEIVDGVTVAPASVAEESPAGLLYTITRAGHTTDTLTINFRVVSQAQFGSEFTVSGAASFDGISGTLTLAGGVSSAQITVTPLDDAVVELTESVELRLVDGDGYIVGGMPSAIGQITSAEFGGDFGDAPLPYPTTLAENGAAHEGFGPTLGNARDIESDGTHSPTANFEGPNDDGVVFGSVRVGQLGATVQVLVQNVPNGARLDAWFDFNRDGNWGGPGEQIFDSVAVVAGSNSLSFDVPTSAADGLTFARFRLSTAGNLGLGGVAVDGEVEDYAVNVAPPSHTEGEFTGPAVIASDASSPYSLAAADMDDDGDMDLISASDTFNEIAWYENDGSEQFTRRPIAPGVSAQGTLVAADVDGDGDLDILSATYPRIDWFENDGNQNFTRQIVIDDVGQIAELFAVDMDGDGDTDVLSASPERVVSWYENDGSQEFTAHIIVATDPTGGDSLYAADIDRDGDLDVVSANSVSSRVSWYENDGVENFIAHTIATGASVAASVFAADVDNDGDMDVLSAASSGVNAISWYENKGSLGFTLRTISTLPNWATNVHAADLDGDGDTDVLSTSSNDARIAWFENDGNQVFTIHTLTTAARNSQLAVADVDGDGALDVVYTSSLDNTIAWFENLDVVSVAVAPDSIAEEGSQELVYTFSRVGGTLGPATIAFEIAGALMHGQDYTATGATSFNGSTGTIVIPAGATSAQVTVHPIDDLVAELDEPLKLTIAAGSGYVASDSASATGFITSAETGGDFGDAPSPYPTLLTENGARHSISGPILGALRDLETDGNHSQSANGDDTSPSMAPDDEDGLVLGTVQIGKLGAVVTVSVSNAPDGARLDAWIDFNGDGNWDGALEQIATSALVQEGSNTIEFDVPGDALPGPTFARFRISTSGGLAPRGVAADGEVEDHPLTIIPTSTALGAFGPQHSIGSSANSVTDVIAVDLDQDGDLDVVSAALTGSRFFIYENVGTTFVSRMISAAADPRDVHAADMDLDGDLDIVAAFAASDAVGWYENLGGFTFARHDITTTADFAKSIDVVDLDRDGDYDVLSASFNDDKIAWYENAGSAGFITHIVSTTVNAANRVFAQDINGDGFIDLLTASEDDDKVRWWENNGQQVFTEHLIADVANPNDVNAADLDADGDADVITAWEGNPYRVLLFENDGAGTFTRHEMAFQSPFSDVRVHAADLDGDGDLDVFSNLNTWYENRGEFNFEAIASGGGGIFAADMDADGDLDLLTGAGSATVWYENVDTGVSVAAAQPTIDEDGGAAAIFTFTRRGLSLEPVTARFLVSGSATRGVDYNIVGATLVDAQWTVTFADGATTAEVSIVPIADDLLDPNETVEFRLVSSDDIAAELPVSATVTIVGTDRLDWGDLPGPYATLSTANGPRHGATGPRLGATRDDEANGQPTAAADGDDTNGADEDGVTFGVIRVGMADASLTVNVQQAPAGARLSAWIDFDSDGNFGGVLERIISDAAVIEGDNVFTFEVPAGAVVGNTFARFRLRTAAGPLGPIGSAQDGEVEDYMVAIAPPGASVGPGDFPHPVATTAFDTFAVDLDRDGDMDVVTTSGAIDSKISWYENDGLGDFTFHTVNTSAPSSTPTSIHAGDLDGDGDIDVVSGWQGQVRIHSNQGNETFATTNLSVSSFGTADVFLADMDGNGRMDIVVTGAGATTIGYLQQTSTNSFTFQSIATTPINPGTVQAVDVDGDGDLDVLAVTNNRHQIFWYENQGTSSFVAHSILTVTTGQLTALAVDLDRDGDTDVVTGYDGATAIQWHENNGSQVFTPRTIKNGFHGTRSVNVADMDGDGDYDVLAGFFSTSSKYEWFRNDGQQNFTLQTIDATAAGSAPIIPADFNGDGDLDALAGTVWYENASNGVTLTSTTASVAEDGGAPIVFTFTRTGSLAQPLTVSFTVGGTATFGSDYSQSGAETFTSSSGTVTFPAMASTAQVTLTPLADSEFEDDETVTLAIAVGVPYAIYAPSTATTKLLDRSEGGDFGDAPAPYSTLRVQNAARHRAVGPTLGSARDTEFDGQPAPGANGDDAGGADEDGVTFGVVPVGQLNVTATVHVQNAPAGARLDAWIDFDGDGNWGGPFEQITISRPVVEGANPISFDVPSSARIGTTVARFRLSTAGGLLVHGWSADGEVEDHILTIAAPITSVGIFSNAKVFGSSTSLSSVFSADVDNDGDMDVLADVHNTNQIVWYLNDGNQNFTTQAVGTSTLPVDALYAADMDRDGDLDVLAATGNTSVGGKIDWYENTGNLVFTAHVGVTANLRYVSVYSADVDGDGDADIISGSLPRTSTAAIEWHENDGQQNFTARSLLTASSARAIHAGDLDRDGDVDIVSGSSTNGIVWHKNLGGGAFSNQVLATGIQDPFSVSITDLDLDGDADILFTLGPNLTGLRWLEQVSSGTFVQRSITTFPPGPYTSVQAGDIDGDGDIDIAAVSGFVVDWYKNNGQQQFTRSFSSSAPAPTQSLHLTDIDGDGDLDTLTASNQGGLATWYENLNATAPGDYDTSGTVNTLDYHLWRMTFGSTSNLVADGNGNGVIDAADYVVWRKNLGSSVLSQGESAASGSDSQTAAVEATAVAAGNDTGAAGVPLDSSACRSADVAVTKTSRSIPGTAPNPTFQPVKTTREAQDLALATRLPRLFDGRQLQQTSREAIESRHDAALASWLEWLSAKQQAKNDSEKLQSRKNERPREPADSQFDTIDEVFKMLAEH